MRKTSLQQKNAKDDENEWRTRQWWTQAQLRGGGTVPSEVLAVVDLQHATGPEKGASEMLEHAKYVRNCVRGRAKDLSHRLMSQ